MNVLKHTLAGTVFALAALNGGTAGAVTGCDHATAAHLADYARTAARRGSFRDAVAAYVAASKALAGCPASDRAGRIDAYVDAAHAVIAGATHAADSPRNAAIEARLVGRATTLRAQIDLAGADPGRLSAVQEADGWVEAARALPHGPLPQRR